VIETNKKYQCIVIDPPWPYRRSWDSPSNRKPRSYEMPYTQMTVREIKDLNVADLASDNCDLYLWATQKFLPAAFSVLNEWGFRYCQTLTWCKTPRGTGQGGLYCPTTEFIILGRIGQMPLDKKRVDSTWWSIKREQRHSQKPEFFMDIFEAMSNPARIELFARRRRLGWDAWGNEAPNHGIRYNHE